MASTTSLNQKAQTMLKKVDIPSAPLWHMGIAAKFNSMDSFNLLQNAIDYLTLKAKQGKSFTDDEKEFLKEIYEAFWWGGIFKGYKEAAQLADYYVNGKKPTLKIDSIVYTSSVIVHDTCEVMKKYIAKQSKNGNNIKHLKSSDPVLQTQAYFRQLTQKFGKPKRDFKKQGLILNNGVLLTEQNNLRLKYADNRFVLNAYNSFNSGNEVVTRWRVENKYDFEPFGKNNYISHFPLSKTMVLKIPDGLSNYMAKIGVAKEFDYYSEWVENWDLTNYQ